MIVVYNKPATNQKAELSFQKFVLSNFPNINHIEEVYKLSEHEFSNPFVEIRKLEKKLLKNNSLSPTKKLLALNVLSELPDLIMAAEKPNLISVDFVFVDQFQKKHFLEFHEKQHKKLSINRSRFVYDVNKNQYQIPRFMQRFLKDVWRFDNLPNYKIVWSDWFEKNSSLNRIDIFNSNSREYFLENQFSFYELLK